MEMKEEALKLADELEGYYWGDGDEELTPSMLIRRLVEELDRLDYDLKSLANRYKALDRTKPLSDEEIQVLINNVPDYDIGIYDLFKFARAIEERHGIK